MTNIYKRHLSKDETEKVVDSTELTYKLSSERIMNVIGLDDNFSYRNVNIAFKEIEKYRTYEIIPDYMGYEPQEQIDTMVYCGDDFMGRKIHKVCTNPQYICAALISYKLPDGKIYSKIIFEIGRGATAKCAFTLIKSIIQEFMDYSGLHKESEMRSYVELTELEAEKKKSLDLYIASKQINRIYTRNK